MKMINKILPPGNFFAEEHAKDLLVIHATAGYDEIAAWNTFNAPGFIATTFIVARNGDVIKCMPAKAWAYHLGQKELNPGHINEKRSVSVEMVNIGPLTLKQGKYYDYVGRVWKGEVVKCDYRGYKYYAAFTPEQTASLGQLINELNRDMGIPTTLLPNPIRYSYCPNDVLLHKGIIFHTNVRRDKWDMPPAFPMDDVMAAVGKKK